MKDTVEILEAVAADLRRVDLAPTRLPWELYAGVESAPFTTIESPRYALRVRITLRLKDTIHEAQQLWSVENVGWGAGGGPYVWLRRTLEQLGARAATHGVIIGPSERTLELLGA